MKKIIDYGNVWTCSNMDNLAPIDWEGYKVLFSDGSIKIIDDLAEVREYEKASVEEYKERLKEWCPNVHFIDYPVVKSEFGDEYFDCPSYVDHGNAYELDKIFESKQRVADLVFNGLIRTTNDNSYNGDEIDEWIEPKDAKITFWKGN